MDFFGSEKKNSVGGNNMNESMFGFPGGKIKPRTQVIISEAG